MAVNISKTAALLTGSQPNKLNQLRLRSQAGEWKTCDRYSGVHIDRPLRMVPQVDYVIQTRSRATLYNFARNRSTRLRPAAEHKFRMIAGVGWFVKNDVIASFD
ncbi:hypothetical protein EVAR_21718_1 [Eumeta japonica]|uniref:Uncharacterized protein n=1 Tax=Eumeta variegata TaxID=151549 RepID=A0A4C1W7Q2_EUMVA|nr:hypothetical protein EVAR_21718_1 [Eumeta japonica]